MEQKRQYPYHTDPYRQYRLNMIETSSPVMLVLLLYDEAIKLCEQALKDLGKNKESVHNKLIKAQKILTELTVALNTDVGGDLAENLKSLYVYLHMRLVEANVHNDSKKIEEVLTILKDLREAWQFVSTEQRKGIVRQAGHVTPTTDRTG
ncbi:MAG: flagellar export chaperone FliS [bacterium]